MAFGRLITKWRSLRCLLEVPLAKCGLVFQACCILHNYCIDKKTDDMETPRIEAAYVSNEAVLGYVSSDTGTVPASGSILCQRLVQKISSSSLSRPELNKRRRAFEDARKQMYYDPTS
jgi:hypothetical protein